MLELTDDPAFAREVVLHAWATKYLTSWWRFMAVPPAALI